MPYKRRFLYILKSFLKASKYASGFSIAVVGFLALSMFWAWGVKLNTDSVNIFPSQYVVESGNWINPDNILTLELSDNAISDEFTAENSAMPETEASEDEEQSFSSSIIVHEFDITELRQEMDRRGGKSTMEISELRLMLSMAALADTGTPGVLSIEASVNSKNRHKIAEIKQNTYYSNSINEGYYSFSLDPIFSELNGRLTSNDIENLEIFVTYKTENSEPAALQIDSIWLSLDFELVRTASARPKVKLDKGENVLTYKDTFSSNESPIMTFSNPELSLQDIKNMAEAGDVEVVEDKFRTLTKKNIVFEMLEEQETPSPSSEDEGQVEKIVEKLEANLGSLLKKEESAEQEATVAGEEEEAGPVEEEEQAVEDEPEPTEDNSDTKEDSDNVDNQDSSDNPDTKEEVVEPANLQEDVEEEVVDVENQEEEIVEETEEPVVNDAEGQDNTEGEQVSFNPLAVKTAYAQSASIQDFSFYLVNPRGERVPAEVEVSRYFEGSREMFDVQIQKPENSFIPGRYTLEAELETSDSIVVLQQDFSWGVLAINFNKSIYTIEDKNAYIQMGAIDDAGHTLCNAELELKVSTPNNKISYFTTGDESINKSEYCNGDSFSPEPDYYVNYYLSGVEGVYDLELTATTQNGTRSITDSFEVRDLVPFDVERTGPTRIFPLENYEMRMVIRAEQDFSGDIIETVPENFEIVDSNFEFRISNFETNSNNKNSKQIIWETDLTQGEQIELLYVFDPPNISPEFYLLGPLEIGEFSEARQWQIASDAILTPLQGAPNWEADDTAFVDFIDPQSGGSPQTLSLALDDTDADFQSMDDLSWQVTYFLSGTAGNDTYQLLVRIVNGGTILAAADAGGTFQEVAANVTSTTDVTTGPTAFSFVNTTAGKAVWDGASIELQQVHTKLQGWDNNFIRTDFTEFTGNYTPSATTIDISGSSDVASTAVAVAVNDTRQAQTATTAAGPCPCAWSITGVTQPGTGDTVTVWLNTDGAGDASESTAVTLYSGAGNVTGLELDANVLSIGTTGAYANQSLSVTNLSLYDFDSGSDGGDEDVMHTANSGTLDVEGSTNSYTNEVIRVEAGDTLTIGGTETLDTHNVQIDGTLTSGGAGTFTVSGSWDNNSVFNASGETVTFTSTSTGETIDSTGATTAAFNGITFNGSGGEWTVSSALSANGNLTMTAGTLLGSQNIDVLGGAVTGNGDINLTGGTFTLDGAGNFGGNTAWDFNNLTFGDGTGTTTTTATGTGSITVAGTLSVSANQTLDAGSKTWILTDSTGCPCTPLSLSGDNLTENASTFIYRGTSATNITATTYNNLESSAAATVTHTLQSGTVTVNGNFTIGNTTDLQTVDADDQDPTLSISGNLTINSNADLLASGTGTFEVAGSWTNSGTFTNNGGSVTFNAGSGTVNIDSTGAALDDFNNIVFDDSGGTATFLLASALDVNGGLTITGGTLDVDATDNNQINVAGNWTNNDIFEARSGLVVLDGLTSANLDAGCTAFNDCANGNFNDLEINKTDGAEANDNITLTSTDLNVANTLTITDGELIQGALNVQAEGTTTSVSIAGAGEWFNISTGNLILDGDFINNGIAIFNANGTTCGDADSITITNISNTPDWDGTGTFTLKDVNISNQNAVASITVEDSTNGGNTGNFTFSGCSITIQGNVLQDDESTFVGNPPCDGSTAVVSLRINGGTETTADCDDTTGFYEFANITPNAGDTLTIYLNSNSTPKANLALVIGAANVLDADLYQNTVIVRDEDNGTATILETLDWDSSTEAGSDMLFDAISGSPNTITLDSGIELHVWTGDVFSPGGTVTTQGAGDVHVDDSATMNIDNASSVIAGDVLVDGSATFQVQQNVAIQGGDITTSGTSAVVNYTGTPTVTISGTGSIGGGTTPSITFYNLVISGTQTMASATTTENNLTVDGTMQGSASVTTTVNGDVIGSGIINFTGGTFEQRVAISQNFGVASGTNNWIFNNLTFSNSDGVTGRTIAVPNGTGTITINGNFLVSKSGDTASITVDAGNRTWVIAGTGGNPFDTDEAGGVLNGQSSTFEYTGNNGAGNTTVEDASYTNLTFTGSETYVPEGATSASNDLTVNTNATLGGSQNITVNGSVIGSGTINLSAGTFEQRISAAETFGASSGVNSWTFNDLTFSNADGAAGHTVSVNTGATGAVVVVNGIMRVSNTGDTQATTLNAGDKTYTLSNANAQNPLDIDLAGGVLDAQTSTFEYTGDFDAGDVHIENASYNNLTLGGAVVENYNPTEAAITVSNDLTINANGTLIGTNNVTLNGSATGAGAVNVTGGVFEQRVSANENFGTSSDSANWIFNDLTFSNSNTDTTTDVTISTNAGAGQIIVGQTLTVAGSGDIGGNGTTFDNETTNDRILDAHHVTINPQGILTASSTATFTVSGNWTNDGALNEGSGSIEFDGSTSATIDSGCTDFDNCTSENFNDIEINKTAGTDADDNITLINTDLRLSGTLTITNGELIQDTLNVRAEGASAVSIASGAGAKWTNTSSGNLTLGGTFAAADATITFQSGGAACGDFNSILIRSTSGGTQRAWSDSGATFNFNDVDVQDQAGTSTIVVNGGTGSNNGGNWSFPPCSSGRALPTLYPGDGTVTGSGDGTDSGVIQNETPSACSTGGVVCADSIDDWIGGGTEDDDTTFNENDQSETSATQFYQLTDMPSDFITMNSVDITVRWRDLGNGNDTLTLTAIVYASNETTILADDGAGNPVAVRTHDGTQDASFTTSANIPLTINAGNNTKTNWDGARLALVWTYAQLQGKDNMQIRVTATELNGVYTPNGIMVAGNAYENETATALVACDGTTNMIAVRTGGTTYGPVPCADADGYFEILGITQPVSGNPIFIWIDGTTCNNDNVNNSCATTMIIDDGGGDIINSVARRSRLIVRHDNAGPADNLDLSIWDNADDSDIVYNVDDATDNLVTENNIKLIVNTFNNFTPGANISTSPSNDGTNSVIDGDILIQASATLGMQANTLDVGGDFENAGTFSKSAGQTTTFTATATGHEITDGGNNFENIIFNGTSGGWSFADSTIVDGDITMTAGELSGTNDITVNGGDVTGTATINLTGGNLTIANSNGTANFGGGTYTFNNLTIGDGGADTTQLNGNITVTSVLTITANDTLDANNDTITLSGISTPFVINGTFTPNSSTVDYTGQGTTNIAEATYWNLESSPASADMHRLGTEGGQTITVSNDLTVGDGTNASILDADNFDPVVDLNRDFTINANAQYSASAISDLRVARDFANSGTFTNNSGEIIFDTTTTSTIAGTGTAFGDFTSTTSGKALLFMQNETFQIDGFFNIQGTSGVGNEITINSVNDTNQWLINHQGTEDLDFVSVKNSGCDASSTDINVFTSDNNVDVANNDYDCWKFFEFIPLSQDWRWYDDENQETPVVPLAGVNTAPSGTDNGDVMKLRFTIAETNGGDATDIRYKIQFSTDSGFLSGVNDVAESCSGSPGWCYGDGVDSDHDPILSLLLSPDSDTEGTHNESGATPGTYDHQPNTRVEFEFTLQQSGASADTAYFFRAYDTLNDAPVAKNGVGETYPSIVTGGTTLDFQISGLSSGTPINDDVTTTIGTTSTQVNFGTLGFGPDEKAAHRLQITTNASEGYAVYLYERQALTGEQGATFDPISGTNNFPSAWSPGCSGLTSCYGYHTTDTLLSGGSTRFGMDDTYAAFSTSPEEVAFNSSSVTNEEHDVVYRIQTSEMQDADNYQTNLVYIIVPTF